MLTPKQWEALAMVLRKGACSTAMMQEVCMLAEVQRLIAQGYLLKVGQSWYGLSDKGRKAVQCAPQSTR